MDREVLELGYLTLAGKTIAKMTGLCIAENPLTLKDQALVAIEFNKEFSGDIRLQLVEVEDE